MAVNVNFVGRLGRDAEKHDGQNGGSFVSYNIAVDEYNPQTKQNDTVWIRVTDGSERTINMVQYLKKGTMLQVYGTERVSLYNGQNGVLINRDVRAYNWDFVRSGKQEGETSTENSQTQQSVQPQQTVQPQVVQSNATTGSFVRPDVLVQASTDETDDLPF